MKRILLLSFLFLGCNRAGPPEDSARRWSTGLGLRLQGVSCATRDSDNDGYVSCVALITSQGSVAYEGLLCDRQGVVVPDVGGCKPAAAGRIDLPQIAPAISDLAPRSAP